MSNHKYLDEYKKLRQLLAEYEAKYPNAPSILKSSGTISPRVLIPILEEANGRRIRFIRP